MSDLFNITEPAVLLRLPCGLCTLIDLADLPRVYGHHWAALWQGPRQTYVIAWIPREGTQGLHRWLMGLPEGLVVDHINGDGLDNRRSVNLRAVTAADNARNRPKGPRPLINGILPPGVPIVTLGRRDEDPREGDPRRVAA